MPAVFADSILIHGRRRVHVKILLNTGGIDAQLVVPKRLANKLGVETVGKARIDFGGKTHLADVGSVKTVAGGTRKSRGAVLKSIVLPDEVLGRPLLGVTGLEKLKITPDVTMGEIIFK